MNVAMQPLAHVSPARFRRLAPWFALSGVLIGLLPAIGLLGPNNLSADDGSRRTSRPDGKDVAAEAAQLGDASFAAREHATRKLIEWGVLSKPALLPMLDDPDAEVRSRARQILTIVSESDFRLRLEAFATDADGRLTHELPCWQRYLRVFDNSRDARSLFVAMQRAEPRLLDVLETEPKHVTTQFADRCRAVQFSLHNQQEPGVPTVSAGTVAALLFVGADESVRVDEQESVYLYNIIHYPAFESGLKGGTTMPLFKKLLGRWVAKYSGASTAIQKLELAFSYDLKEGADLAKSMLAEENGQPDLRTSAFLALGRFGNADCVPLLEHEFKDERICQRQQRNLREAPVQVRDVALAIAIHLTGQNVKTYGFTHAQPNSAIIFTVGSLGFEDDKKRDEAFKKWSDWKKAVDAK
jgi:hypothetical protein